MDYEHYLQEIDRAAEATGGQVTSLAGGYFGVELAADGARVVLALDLDTDEGWVAWREDYQGERCCDVAEEVLGDVPLTALRERALSAVATHRHSRDLGLSL